MIGKIVDRLNTWSDHIDVRNTIDQLGLRKEGMTYTDAVRQLFSDFLNSETERGIITHKYRNLTKLLHLPAPDTLAGLRDHPDPPGSARERGGAPDHEDPPQFRLHYSCRFCGGSYDHHIPNGSGAIVCNGWLGYNGWLG